ncbi:hypothetical protein KFE25_006512 [Diacronema lutheri]|uniref:Uncharacterized protein n=1 Tax=Diacronema lutheri TaxID=2081491 RepID=A0A8J5XX03_DIALT|nr:hypothetical protein KFE25_006512 [Diacronema lutheri]
MLLISGLRDFADIVLAQPGLVLRKNNAFDLAAADVVYGFCFAHGIRMSVVSRNAVPLLPMQLARSFAVRTESEVLRYLANAQFLGLASLWQKLCNGQLPARCDKAWYFATFCGIEGAEFERRALGDLDERADILVYLNGFVKPYDVIAAMTVLSTTSGWFSPDAEVVVNGTAHLLLLGAEHAMDVRSVHNLLRETYHSVALLDADARRRRRFPLSMALLGSRRAATVADLPSNRAPLPPPHEQPPNEQSQPVHEPQQQQLPPPPPQQQQPQEPRAALRAVSSFRPPANARPSGVRASANVLSMLPRASSSASAVRMASATQRASSSGGGALTAWRRRRVGAPRRFVPQARVSVWWSYGAPHDAQLRPSMTRLSAATVVNMLHADRLRSADGAASHELTAELLARSVDEARVRQTVVMLRVAVITAFLCTGALAVVLTSLVPANARRRDAPAQPAEQGGLSTLARPAPIDAVVLARAQRMVLTFGFGATGNLIALCFHPSAQQRVRILASDLFGAAVVTVATAPWLATIVRLAPPLAAGAVPVGAREVSVLVEVLIALLQVLVNAACVVRGLVLFWRHRADAHKLMDATWSMLAVLYAGTSAVSLAEFIARAAGIEFSNGLSGGDAGLTFLAFPSKAGLRVGARPPATARAWRVHGAAP